MKRAAVARRRLRDCMHADSHATSHAITHRHFKMTGAGWHRDDLFETRDPKPGEDYGPGESLLLFGDVLGTGTVAGER